MFALIIHNLQEQIFVITLNRGTGNNIPTLVGILVALEPSKTRPAVSRFD
jgi:hypothetical protein